MSELKPCPFCGGEAKFVHIFENPEKCMVSCRECDGGIDAVFANEEAAVAAWNRRTQPANEPLTLEQLREMDFRSDPIWDSCLNVWCAVRTELSTDQKKSIYYFGGGNRPLETNRFYSRKPEKEK